MKLRPYTERISAEDIMYDLDYAIKLLGEFVSVDPEKIKSPKDYVNSLHILTRAINIGNVDGEIPDDVPEKEVVSLLRKAESQIIWEGEYFADARRIIKIRRMNLRRANRGLDLIPFFDEEKVMNGAA